MSITAVSRPGIVYQKYIIVTLFYVNHRILTIRESIATTAFFLTFCLTYSL